MVPASADQSAAVDALYATRVLPDVPAFLCDDEQLWQKEWRALKAARRQRPLIQLEELGLDVEDFKGASRADMIAALRDELDADADEGGRTEDDDSSYGPYSYFARAMAKDD